MVGTVLAAKPLKESKEKKVDKRGLLGLGYAGDGYALGGFDGGLELDGGFAYGGAIGAAPALLTAPAPALGIAAPAPAIAIPAGPAAVPSAVELGRHTHTQTTITRNIGIPVPHPVPYPVDRPVPISVPVKGKRVLGNIFNETYKKNY